MANLPHADRDLSWLSFNDRVLDEAHDPSVPLASRVKFLAIFSANLDEFFRVRVAALRQLSGFPNKKRSKLPVDPQVVLTEIADLVGRQQQRVDTLFDQDICPQLAKAQVVLYRDESLPDGHRQEAAAFFRATVLSFLQPVFVGTHRRLKRRDKLPLLDGQTLYFALTLRPRATHQPKKNGDQPADEPVLAYLNIPSRQLGRFIELTPLDGVSYYLFLDELIRANLSMVFPGYDIEHCFSFTLNRAEDISIQDEYRGNLVKKIKVQLSKRKTAPPVRFLYDRSTPPDLLDRFVKLLRLQATDLMAGGRYHHLSDLMKLPLTSKPGLAVSGLAALPSAGLEPYESMLEAIGRRDHLLHFPYQFYSYVLRFFNEAAIDPLVYDIQVALYRLASDSLIANALMSAARNGKRVRVFVEVKARFDEANNLRWAEEMERAGVHIMYSMPGVKVHAKIALVKRTNPQRKGKPTAYAYLSTGNFNEATAEVYTDQGLFTTHSGMVRELDSVFRYLHKQKPIHRLRHLLVAPFNLQDRYLALIEREIRSARKGKKAGLIIKLNGLEDAVMIDKLYEAHQAGVRVQLIVRGICCLVPGLPGVSEGIEVVRLVDQFLEHSRIALFHNRGKAEVYLASADWMNRNLYHRVEVGFPVYDPTLKKELAQLLALQLSDTVKGRHLDALGHNQPATPTSQPGVRAQVAFYDWLKEHR